MDNQTMSESLYCTLIPGSSPVLLSGLELFSDITISVLSSIVLCPSVAFLFLFIFRQSSFFKIVFGLSFFVHYRSAVPCDKSRFRQFFNWFLHSKEYVIHNSERLSPIIFLNFISFFFFPLCLKLIALHLLSSCFIALIFLPSF